MVVETGKYMGRSPDDKFIVGYLLRCMTALRGAKLMFRLKKASTV
ncbi:MAG: hypothetical protein ACLR23_17030 [Clostridia bacterium]